MIIGRLPFYDHWKRTYSRNFLKRRFEIIRSCIPLDLNQPIRVLEVGCANGKDFIQFLADSPAEVWGVDLNPSPIQQENVKTIIADAAELPFPDNYFDLVVSVGLLEHIEPMEKLCTVIQEMDRVGKHVVSVVPSISTPLEPHCGKLFFPTGLHRSFCSPQEGPLHLNFFSEHTWTKFEGFCGCSIRRFFYIPPLIRNTIIYK